MGVSSTSLPQPVSRSWDDERVFVASILSMTFAGLHERKEERNLGISASNLDGIYGT